MRDRDYETDKLFTFFFELFSSAELGDYSFQMANLTQFRALTLFNRYHSSWKIEM